MSRVRLSAALLVAAGCADPDPLAMVFGETALDVAIGHAGQAITVDDAIGQVIPDDGIQDGGIAVVVVNSPAGAGGVGIEGAMHHRIVAIKVVNTAALIRGLVATQYRIVNL